MEFLQILLIVFVLIAVHETGHFLAGITSGIPASHMRIRLFTFPQHVAIKDGDAWLSSSQDIKRYIEVTRGFLTSKAAAFRWVAGGVLLECVFTVAVCLVAHGIGWTNLAFWTAAMSLAMYLVNVFLMDVPWALIKRHAFGDTSGLWTIARMPAVLLTLAMLAIRAGVFWFVAQAA